MIANNSKTKTLWIFSARKFFFFCFCIIPIPVFRPIGLGTILSVELSVSM